MNKIIAIVIVLIIVFLGIWHELSYPSAWDDIHLGMSRQEVYKIIGHGIDEFPDWKGPFWIDSNVITENQIEIHFKNEQVSYIFQRQLLIKRPLREIRSEAIPYK
jgi:hypothetical protein